MTGAGRLAQPRLDRDTVVAAALALLDESGMDAVSTRAVAARLGVRMNTVLWHVKTKARLLELMADAIIGSVPADDLPDDWKDRAGELMRRLRRALLAHRDGAAVVTGTYSAEPGTLGFAEHLVSALLAAGLDEREAAWTSWSLVYYTLGLVQEEQSLPVGDNRLRAAVTAGRYPALDRTVAHFEPAAMHERFDFGIDLILTAAAQRVANR